jgi:hypothetical protein
VQQIYGQTYHASFSPFGKGGEGDFLKSSSIKSPLTPLCQRGENSDYGLTVHFFWIAHIFVAGPFPPLTKYNETMY